MPRKTRNLVALSLSRSSRISAALSEWVERRASLDISRPLITYRDRPPQLLCGWLRGRGSPGRHAPVTSTQKPVGVEDGPLLHVEQPLGNSELNVGPRHARFEEQGLAHIVGWLVIARSVVVFIASRESRPGMMKVIHID